VPKQRMNYERTTLPNGLRLLTTYIPGMRSASIAFFFSVGSRYEPDALAGVSHFIEHMLFKGSTQYPSAKAISEAIEGVGGSFNGSTGKELTAYTARVPGEYLSVVLHVMADMIRHPLFDAQELEKERGVIIEEISSTQDDPQEWVNLLADEVMWPDLPLGRDDAGSIDSVSHLQRQQLLDYLHTHYRPNSLVISVAGNIQPAQVVEQVNALFGDWEPGERLQWSECLPPREAKPVRIIKKKTEQTNICLATLGTAYASPDYNSLLLINGLLGDGMSSRLFQSIREDQGLAYDIGSYFNSYYETGSMVISAGVDPSRTQATIRAIIAELELLCHEPVPVDELERTKAYVRGGIVLSLEGTQQVASWLGSQECLYDRIWDIDEVVARVDAVTIADIQRVARICFAPEWRRLAIIGPDDPRQANRFEKLLAGA
jgi:Predicted Zn-dependent peptidases